MGKRKKTHYLLFVFFFKHISRPDLTSHLHPKSSSFKDQGFFGVVEKWERVEKHFIYFSFFF
jgi:hypothetical protein